MCGEERGAPPPCTAARGHQGHGCGTALTVPSALALIQRSTEAGTLTPSTKGAHLHLSTDNYSRQASLARVIHCTGSRIPTPHCHRIRLGCTKTFTCFNDAGGRPRSLCKPFSSLRIILFFDKF